MVKKTEYKIYTERECKEEPYRKKYSFSDMLSEKMRPWCSYAPAVRINSSRILTRESRLRANLTKGE